MSILKKKRGAEKRSNALPVLAVIGISSAIGAVSGWIANEVCDDDEKSTTTSGNNNTQQQVYDQSLFQNNTNTAYYDPNIVDKYNSDYLANCSNNNNYGIDNLPKNTYMVPDGYHLEKTDNIYENSNNIDTSEDETDFNYEENFGVTEEQLKSQYKLFEQTYTTRLLNGELDLPEDVKENLSKITN